MDVCVAENSNRGSASVGDDWLRGVGGVRGLIFDAEERFGPVEEGITKGESYGKGDLGGCDLGCLEPT